MSACVCVGKAGKELREAAMGGDVAAVERLLAAGADVDAADGVRVGPPARSRARVCAGGWEGGLGGG